MQKPARLNPNLIGLIAILVWGSSIPVSKILMTKLGLFAVLGGVQAFSGVLGIIREKYVVRLRTH